jgi:hypothetical protein
VQVCLNVRVVDPGVTQLVTQQPRPEFRGSCALTLVRADANGCGQTRTRQSACPQVALVIYGQDFLDVGPQVPLVIGVDIAGVVWIDIQ